MFKTWCIYFLTLTGTFIFFLVYKMWVSWYCLMLLLLVPAAAFAMCRLAAEHLSFSTEIPPILNVGDKAFLKIDIGGIASQLSVVRFKAVITDKMADKKTDVRYSVFDKGVTKVAVDTDHCGSYSYNITKIRIYDLFGFFHTTCSVDRNHEIVVRPVPIMPHLMPNLNGFKAKSLRKSKHPLSEIYDIRDYIQGDPVKSIHWKMSAKRDKLIVKEPLEEYAGRSRVLIKLTADRKELDIHLGEMLFTSRYFLEHDITHKIRVVPPNKCEVSYDVECEADLERALTSILRMKLPKEELHAT